MFITGKRIIFCYIGHLQTALLNENIFIHELKVKISVSV